MSSGMTNVFTDLLGQVSTEHTSLKAEMDALLKQWDESTERYHGAGGTDSLNGNLQQQAAQAREDANKHGKATGERTQRTADTSKEAQEAYGGTDGDNGVTITNVMGTQIVPGVGSGGSSSGAAPGK